VRICARTKTRHPFDRPGFMLIGQGETRLPLE
jgi:hypothetical protein